MPSFFTIPGSIRPPRMWNTMFNRVQPMFNPFEAAGTTYVAVSASVIIWVPKSGESKSGQMVSEKVIWS